MLESILRFFGFFFWQKDSAHRLIDRYIRYISAILEGPLRVTAELTEMVQYTPGRRQHATVIYTKAHRETHFD